MIGAESKKRGGKVRLGEARARESMVQAFRQPIRAQESSRVKGEKYRGNRDRVWRKKSAGGDGGRENSIGVETRGTSNEQKACESVTVN